VRSCLTSCRRTCTDEPPFIYVSVFRPEIYIDRLDVSYPLAWDNGKAVKEAYRNAAGLLSLGASAVFVVDRTGTIVWREQFGQGAYARPDCKFPTSIEFFVGCLSERWRRRPTPHAAHQAPCPARRAFLK
jgi:hypothetical protein